MLTRVITSVVALIVFFAVIFAGVLPLQIAIVVVVGAMLYEIFTAITKSAHIKVCGYIVGFLMLAGSYLGMIQQSLALGIIVTMVFLVMLHGKNNYKELFSVILMALYIPVFMGYIPRLRIEMGLPFMALIFIIAWGSDTSAYFCGTFFGKHKLIPRVSPKKTVEGAVGALVCVMIICMVYAFIMYKTGKQLGDISTNPLSYLKIGILGAIAAAISQMGDLAASAIKRDAGIKDYGKIFPGHGGFMDRFDSVIFISPVVYYYCMHILGIG